jgi:hypothetical protein
MCINRFLVLLAIAIPALGTAQASQVLYDLHVVNDPQNPDGEIIVRRAPWRSSVIHWGIDDGIYAVNAKTDFKADGTIVIYTEPHWQLVLFPEENGGYYYQLTPNSRVVHLTNSQPAP